MKIIGLTGAAGSGKDTACGFALEWCEEQGLKAERVAFADPLKISAAACFGYPASKALEFCNWLKQPGVFVTAERQEGEGDIPLTVAEAHGIKGKRVSGRQFLQFFGTEGHRDVFGQSFWTDALLAVIEEKEQEGADVVFITDTRFENEGRAVAEIGEVWSVQRKLTHTVEAHASEEPLPSGMIEFDINNDGDLNDLRELIRSVCEHNIREVGA